MKYLVYRAFQKLWINRKIYFVIMLEFAIGIAVVLCGISSAYSARSRLELYKQQLGENGVVIAYSRSGDSTYTGLPVTVEDYKIMQERYSGVDISYLLFTHSIYQTREASDVESVTFVSMDEASFLRCFGFVPQDDVIYIGPQVADDLEEEGMNFFENWLTWEESGAVVGGLDFAHIVRLNPLEDSVFVSPLIELKVNQLVILPEKCMDVLERNAEGNLTPCLRIVPGSNGDGLDTAYEVVQMLQEGHTDYSYRISEQYLELQKSIKDLTQAIRLFSWVAWLVLGITTVGIIGILLIYMEKRKRELAIILSLGGTHATIFQELFWEVFSLCFMSGCIGLTAAILAVPYLSTGVFTASFHWISIAVMLGIVLMVTVISCTCVVLGIREVYPTKILKK